MSGDSRGANKPLPSGYVCFDTEMIPQCCCGIA